MSHQSLSKTIAATANVTGRRFCSHHQGEVLAADGCVVDKNRSRRWICYTCQAKTQKRLAEILAAKPH